MATSTIHVCIALEISNHTLQPHGRHSMSSTISEGKQFEIAIQQQKRIKFLKWHTCAFDSSTLYHNTPQRRDIIEPIAKDIHKEIIIKHQVETTAVPSTLKAARVLADSCNTLNDLREAVTNFQYCDLKKVAISTVFGDGNPKAKVILIGEAPGANEDKCGIPFCGQSGKLLDNILKSICLTRENVYITNTVFWRPPGNRRPTKIEIETCRPFVERHIALINPKLIILIGSTALEALLEDTRPITSLRGHLFKYTNCYLSQISEHNGIKTSHPLYINVTTIFHPSYLLRQPLQKKQMWFDVLKIKKMLSDLHITD